MVKRKKKYYGTKIVHTPGFSYKVAFLSPAKSLGNSKMLSAWTMHGKKKIRFGVE